MLNFVPRRRVVDTYAGEESIGEDGPEEGVKSKHSSLVSVPAFLANHDARSSFS
jgi:hypothetical protein